MVRVHNVSAPCRLERSDRTDGEKPEVAPNPKNRAICSRYSCRDDNRVDTASAQVCMNVGHYLSHATNPVRRKVRHHMHNIEGLGLIVYVRRGAVWGMVTFQPHTVAIGEAPKL